MAIKDQFYKDGKDKDSSDDEQMSMRKTDSKENGNDEYNLTRSNLKKLDQ